MNETVIALGFFDGLHLGHAELIKCVKRRAAQLGAVPTVLTFDAHPDNFVTGRPVELLTDSTERADMVRRLFGVENVIFVHFNETVMRMPWREFLDSLRTEFAAVHLVVGHDFHFGYRGEGNAARLDEYCREYGLGCDVIPPVMKGGAIISSTRIRELVRAGDMSGARALLGHPHELCDTVRCGHRLGRTMGAPTINMCIPENVIVPRFGVYAVRAYFAGGEHIAVTNIGIRPTFKNGTVPSVESYILDYSGNLYGRRVRVEFYEFIRPEREFASREELAVQIRRDEQAVRAYFAAL